MPMENPKTSQTEIGKTLTELEEQFNATNWEGESVHKKAEPTIDVERQRKQMDRLRDTRKDMREEKTSFSHNEARELSEDYKLIQTKISAIRKRLADIALHGQGREKAAEVQKLRDELAVHFKAYRKFIRGQQHTNAETDSYAHLSEEEKIDAKNWEGLSSVLSQVNVPEKTEVVPEHTSESVDVASAQPDQQLLKVDKKQETTVEAKDPTQFGGQEFTNSPYEWHAPADVSYTDETLELLGQKVPQNAEATFATQWQVTPDTISYDTETAKMFNQDGVVIEPAEVEKPLVPEQPDAESKFEVRSEIREQFKDWNTKKKAYQEAYEKYLSDKKTSNNKKSWFRKEQQPEALRELEAAYNKAGIAYSESVKAAVEKRAQAQPDNNAVKTDALRPMLAKHLLLRDVEQKIALEKEYALENRGKAIFDKTLGLMQKNKVALKAIGYATAVGVGIASGSLFSALLGHKASLVAIAGGSTLGAVGTAVGYDALVLDGRKERKENAVIASKRSYSEKNFEALKKELYESSKKYDSALENRKYVVAGGAIAGGMLAGAAFGNVDMDAVMDGLPDIPDTEPQIPPEPVYVPNAIPDGGASVDGLPDGGTDDYVYQQNPQENPADSAVETQKNLHNYDKSDLGDMNESNAEKIDNFEKVDLGDMNESDSSKVDNFEKDFSEDGGSPEEVVAEPIEYTFEPGSKVNTGSEALFETWKADHGVLEDSSMTKNEFLADMYGAIAELENDPAANAELLEKMGIDSGDIDKVQVGQTIDLQPFFEYLNQRN
jgi:hypothetical protein